MMNFTSLQITNKYDYRTEETRFYCVNFIFSKREDKNNHYKGTIEYDSDKNIRFEVDFYSSVEEKRDSEGYRIDPIDGIVPIENTEEIFYIGDKLSLVQKDFIGFLESNGIPMEIKEGIDFFWNLKVPEEISQII